LFFVTSAPVAMQIGEDREIEQALRRRVLGDHAAGFEQIRVGPAMYPTIYEHRGDDPAFQLTAGPRFGDGWTERQPKSFSGPKRRSRPDADLGS
jgi:hypothetical protein